MSTTNTIALGLPQGIQTNVIDSLDLKVNTFLGQGELVGFKKAYVMAEAVAQLKQALTPEYMKPIMAMQGLKIGFKTDLDKSGGYKEETVRNCLIEAVLCGIQPYGNMFNIIQGQMYVTKEGFEYLLKHLPGLTSLKIIAMLPRINQDKTAAAISMKLSWIFKGKQDSDELDLPIKMNSGMGTDAVIGKAQRKARAWLYSHLTGIELLDADVNDPESLSTPPKMGGHKSSISDTILSNAEEKPTANTSNIPEAEVILEEVKEKKSSEEKAGKTLFDEKK